MDHILLASFNQAGIPAEPATRPILETNPDIFQLDIPRTPSERIRIWAGAADNEVAVLSVDGSLRQLVLRVREPSRPYEDRVRIRQGRVTRAQIEEFVRESGGRVLRPRGSSWLVERWTDPADRRFLAGYDHRHLFAAQVPGGDTVAGARDALMPPEVRAADPGRVTRQGEWFFVRLREAEDDAVRAWAASAPFGLERNRALPGEGQPHRAEELVRMPGAVDPRVGLRPVHLYVRGRVRHADHATISFDRWRRVHLNAEVRRRASLAPGFFWRD